MNRVKRIVDELSPAELEQLESQIINEYRQQFHPEYEIELSTTSEGDWTFTFDNGFILDRDDEQIDGLAYVGEWAVADGKVTVAQFERFYCPPGGWTPKSYWSRVRAGVVETCDFDRVVRLEEAKARVETA
jgi:hypothetical protein